MFGVEESGAISHLSVWHALDLFNGPAVGKGHPEKGWALEGQVSNQKNFGAFRSELGSPCKDRFLEVHVF